MIFRTGKFQVEISENVIGILERFKQVKESDSEAGGILLGQVREHNIYISKATVPSIDDFFSRYSFIRGRGAAQLIVNYEFFNNNGRLIYLGEWHTHPEKTPKPSHVDKEMIKEQFRGNKLNEPFLVLLIQGLSDLYVALYDGRRLYADQK